MSQELIIVISLALIFDFLNGMRDASNIVATMISSRALGPRRALAITAIAEFLGPFIFGVVVAKTIGEEIVQSSVLTLSVIALRKSNINARAITIISSWDITD